MPGNRAGWVVAEPFHLSSDVSRGKLPRLAQRLAKSWGKGRVGSLPPARPMLPLPPRAPRRLSWRRRKAPSTVGIAVMLH